MLKNRLIYNKNTLSIVKNTEGETNPCVRKFMTPPR